MKNYDQEFIDALILTIETAEDPDSVTNEMVAAVMDYLNASYKEVRESTKGLTDEERERKAADILHDRAIKDIQTAIDKLSTAIAENQNRLTTLIDGDKATQAIDTFNELKAFLEGVTNKETFLGLLNTVREDLDIAVGSTSKLRSDITALQETVWPLTLTFGVTPVTVEVGKQTNVIASWDVTREGKSVLADSTVFWDAPAPAGTVPSTQKTKTVAVSPTAPGVTAFRMHAEYNGMSKEKTVNVTAVYPTYFGKLAAGATDTESAVKGMTKLVNPSKSFQQTGISLANQRICLAYPKSFGTLTSVKDGNNFETLTAYTRTELTMDGVAYYVYAMTEPVTATGVKQIYS